MYPHIWPHIFCFLCKKKVKKVHPFHYSRLLPAISKRHIRWVMMGSHCSVFPCAAALLFFLTQCLLCTHRKERQNMAKPFTTFSWVMGVPEVILPSMISLRSEKMGSFYRGLIYVASPFFCASLGTISQKKAKDFLGLTCLFSEVTLSM